LILGEIPYEPRIIKKAQATKETKKKKSVEKMEESFSVSFDAGPLGMTLTKDFHGDFTVILTVH
jgi:hypothetical protein